MWWTSSGIVYAPPPDPVAGGAPRVWRASTRTSPTSRRRASPPAPRRRTRPEYMRLPPQNVVTLRRFTPATGGEGEGEGRGYRNPRSATPPPPPPWLPPAPCPPPRVYPVDKVVGRREGGMKRVKSWTRWSAFLQACSIAARMLPMQAHARACKAVLLSPGARGNPAGVSLFTYEIIPVHTEALPLAGGPARSSPRFACLVSPH